MATSRPRRVEGALAGSTSSTCCSNPNASFAEAQSMASQQGEVLPVTKNTLWKRLKDKGKVAMFEKGRSQMKWNIRGNERRVICLGGSALPIAEFQKIVD